MKRLTLEEIGKLSGVSRATVSRVINNYPHIRPEIRERVQTIIDQTGYKPNVVARTLVSNRSNIIGLIIPSVVQQVFSDPYFPTLISGIARGCNANNLVLSLYLFDSLEDERNLFQAIIGTGLIDGLIVTTARRNQEMFDTLQESGFPVVFVGEPDDIAKTTFIDIDNITGGYTAAQYLLELGHRRIAIISTHINRSGESRLEGYRKALHEYGVPFDDHLVAYGDFSLDSGYSAMQSLIPHQPSAVFVTNDLMALGSLRALREAGLRVPEDVSVVSFDDLSPATQADPQLTTIRQPVQQTGKDAVTMLLGLINGDIQHPQHVFLPNELIVRASTGAVRSKSFRKQQEALDKGC